MKTAHDQSRKRPNTQAPTETFQETFKGTLGAQALATLSEIHGKLARGFSTLSRVKSVEVGFSEKECVWEDGHVRLYRFAHKAQKTGVPRRVRTPVLIVYALVNRPYMLDLQPDRSLVQRLLQEGLDVYMIDWGYPTRFEHHLTLDDYVCGYINDCVNEVRKRVEAQKINILGVCQGGTFSTIYAALFPRKVQNLITIATPIDFSVNDGLLFRWAKDMDADTLVDSFSIVPPEILNAGFVMLKPFVRLQKYMSAFETMNDDEKLMNFLRMERWIFDSPGQPGECYRQFIRDLYQDNKLVKGTLKLGKRTVNLKNITMPLMNIYAADDHIVPHSATKALNTHVGSKDKSLYEIPGGHIGIFVGSKAQKELAPAIAAWLAERDGATPPSGAK
jgi:polyhydroxyalkanoate synthase